MERLTEKAGLLRTSFANRSRRLAVSPAETGGAAARETGSNARGSPANDGAPLCPIGSPGSDWLAGSFAHGKPPTKAFDGDSPSRAAGEGGKDSLNSCCFMAGNLPARSIHPHPGFIS
jgi:hypothetical protein